jgi:hypothetical protein
MMKYARITVLSLLWLSSTIEYGNGREVRGSLAIESNSQKETADRYEQFSENVLSFEVPSTWRRMGRDELAVFRQQYEEQSKQLFQQYYGRTEGYEWGVPYICGFFAPRMEVTVVALVMKIPPQKKDYLDEAYARSDEIIKWGLRQGQVRQAFSNKKTEINGMPALTSDLEMGNGSRMIGYTFYFADHPDRGMQVVMLCDPGTYPKYQAAFDTIIRSLRIDFNKPREGRIR